MPKSPDISIERIAQAREHIDPVFLNTPQFENNLLSQWVGTSVIVKVECLNPVRSFKGRGACYSTTTMDMRFCRELRTRSRLCREQT